MKIKAFNEILRGLEGARSTNRNDEVEELAEKLHEQGITTSRLEAKEKAKSMITTEETVLSESKEKKKETTTYNDPRHNPNYNPYKAAMIEEMRKRAVEGREAINIQDEFQTPKFEERNPGRVHSQAAVGMRSAPRVSAVAAQPVMQATPAPRVQEPREQVQEDPAPVEEEPLSNQEPAQEDPILETYDTPEEQKPERKQNPKVDLGSVFSFGKK